MAKAARLYLTSGKGVIYTCIVTQVTKRVSRHRPATPRQAARHTTPLDRSLDADLFKALSDPTRLRLLACLAKCGRACSVTEVAECCVVDFSVVSRHLGTMADAGVLDAQKKGRTMFYGVRYEHLGKTFQALADAIASCCPDDDCCPGAC